MKNSHMHLVVCFIGIISGFTLMISGNTLNFWLSIEKLDIRTIGVFSIISLPYAVNFLWAPIFDTKKIPLITVSFGHRISWVIILQILLSIFVYLLSLLQPSKQIIIFGLLGFGISFLASAQDTILGALRTEMVEKDKQGAVAGTYILGYRLGMLISGYGAIYLSEYISFNIIYELFSLIILIFPMYFIIYAKKINIEIEMTANHVERELLPKNSFLKNSSQFIRSIIQPVGNYKYILVVLIFLIIYRLPDHFIVTMINPFLIKIGYSYVEIANAGKLFGIISAILGGFLASYIMKKIKIIDSLIIFGILHAASHLLFLIQELYGKNLFLLFFVIGAEGITGGMSMAAYIGFIASLCSGRFRATQYSFFSSMMGVSRSIFPAISGYIVANLGWKLFFIFSSVVAIPPIFIAIYLKKYSKSEIL